jgi:hypothetical protein
MVLVRKSKHDSPVINPDYRQSNTGIVNGIEYQFFHWLPAGLPTGEAGDSYAASSTRFVGGRIKLGSDHHRTRVAFGRFYRWVVLANSIIAEGIVR